MLKNKTSTTDFRQSAQGWRGAPLLPCFPTPLSPYSNCNSTNPYSSFFPQILSNLTGSSGPQFLSYPWGSWPKAVSIFPGFRSCWRGCPWHFLQHTVPDPRHPGYFVTRGFFLLCSLLVGPIQCPRHPIFVFARVYGSAFGFFQHPRSSSWWSFHPGLSLCSTWFPPNTFPVQASVFKVVVTGFH